MTDAPDKVRPVRMVVLLCAIGLGVALAALIALLRLLPAGDTNPYPYDVEAFKKTDPALVRYRETVPLRTELTALRGLATTVDDRILVTGDAAVLILDRDGKQVSRIDLGAPARCVAAGQGGDIYLGMTEHVEVYDAKGERKASWGSLGERAFITALAVKGNELFIADAGTRVVWHFSTAGALLGRIGEQDPAKGAPGLVIPSPYLDLAIDPDGFLWVVNPGRHALENYTPDGQLRASWSKASIDVAGFCGCCNPTHLAILPDGSFVTSEKGIVRVKVYKASGVFDGIVAGPEAFAEDTVGLDLAVQASGRILVLDPKRNCIRTFVRK